MFYAAACEQIESADLSSTDFVPFQKLAIMLLMKELCFIYGNIYQALTYSKLISKRKEKFKTNNILEKINIKTLVVSFEDPRPK